MAKHYDKEFKENALKYREDNPKLSVSAVCRNLGISTATYYNWKRSADANDDQVVHRGSQYISKKYLEVCGKELIPSYSRKGNPWDNACIESFHAVIKREWLNFYDIQNLNHAHQIIFEYIETFYNTVRIHGSCGYESPNNYEKQYRLSSIH